MTTNNQPTAPTVPAPSLHLAHSARPAVPRDRLLRLPEVETTTGLKKSSVYAMVRAGKFPRPINISRRMSAWSESSVLSWVQERINQAAAVQS